MNCFNNNQPRLTSSEIINNKRAKTIYNSKAIDFKYGINKGDISFYKNGKMRQTSTYQNMKDITQGYALCIDGKYEGLDNSTGLSKCGNDNSNTLNDIKLVIGKDSIYNKFSGMQDSSSILVMQSWADGSYNDISDNIFNGNISNNNIIIDPSNHLFGNSDCPGNMNNKKMGVNKYLQYSYVDISGNVCYKNLSHGNNTRQNYMISYDAKAGGVSVLNNGFPVLLYAVAGNQKVTLSWTPPFNNGSNITKYTIYYGTSVDSLTPLRTVEPDVNSYTVGPSVLTLNYGTVYHFRVDATNKVGTSYGIIASATWMGTPGPSTLHTATRVLNNGGSAPTGVLYLSWTEPGDNGGSIITGYKIEQSITGEGAGFYTIIPNTGNTTTTKTISAHLQATTSYWFRISAININGTGTVSNALQATPNVPKAPIYVSASGGNNLGTVDLSWNAPEDNGGSAILSYQILQSPSGIEGTYTVATVAPGLTGATGDTVTGLDSSETYWFKVAAFNAVGPGKQSAAVSAAAT